MDMRVIERNTRNVTVRLTNAHWNRLVQLDDAYRTALAVVKAKRECEAKPGMTVEEALNFIETL